MEKISLHLFKMYFMCGILTVVMFAGLTCKKVYAEENLSVDGFCEYNMSSKVEKLFDVSIPESSPDELILEGAEGEEPESSDMTSSGGITTFSIIGDDERYQGKDTTLKPNRWIARTVTYWSDGSTLPGTAWMYGPSAAVTAAHCIYDESKGGYAEKIAVYPAYNNGKKPYGSYKAAKVSIIKRYKNEKKEKAREKYDIGIIKLSSAVGKKTGYFSIRCNNKSYKGQSVYIAGYPKEKTGLWKMEGKILKYENNKFYYQIDTSDGQSGSPVYYGSGSKRYCIGVHTSGTSNRIDGYNSGVKITKTYYYWLKNRREVWS